MLAKFRPEKYDFSSLCKEFSPKEKKEYQNSPDFKEKKIRNRQIFYDKFQQVAKNIKLYIYIYIYIYIQSQIWLNYFLDDHHLGYNEKKP
jgi:hypothetical protein